MCSTSAEGYQALAQRLRAIGAQAHSEEARQEFRRLASLYEALAAHRPDPAREERAGDVNDAD